MTVDDPHARPEPRLILQAQESGESDDIENFDGDDDDLPLLSGEAVETEIQT